MRWYRLRRKRRSTVTQHYLEHKETARELIVARLSHWNQFYGYEFNRVAIRNQKTCWGSCTAKNNLNFSYKLMFLPSHLMDYIIVHELCHLKELNHGRGFWQLVEETLPEQRVYRKQLREIERHGTAVNTLERFKALHEDRQLATQSVLSQ